MSTKNKKIVYYLAAFLVVLMLVCTCLLGNTFARYVTGTSGDATAAISKWSVSKTYGSLSTNQAVSFANNNSLSPNKNGNGVSNVYNSTSVLTVATIEINEETEVDVKVTLSATALTYTTSETISTSATATYTGATNSVPNSKDLENVFTLHVGYIISTSVSTAPTITLATDGSYSSGATSPDTFTALTCDGDTHEIITDWTAGTSSTTYVHIYAWVTWTTNYTAYAAMSQDGTAKTRDGIYVADALDAWIGANISAASTTITAQAVQDSTNPEDN